MKKQHVMLVGVLTLIVILGGVFISACSSVASAQQKSSLDAQVQTAAAATMMQYMVETEVASHGFQQVSNPVEVSQAQPTQTPYPTPTAAPTQTPLPTAVPTQASSPTQAPASTQPPTPAAAAVSGPKIVADENTNCRTGPSTAYTIQTVFYKGAESTVQGRDAGKNWWYIVNPNDSSGSCWVWEGSTTVVGDTSTVAVVDAPAPTYPNSYSPYYGYYGNSGYYGSNKWCGYDAKGRYYCVGYTTACCNNNCAKKKANCCNAGYCYPNQQICNPNYWYGYAGGCGGYSSCGCAPVFYQNPCKKSNCPPVTGVNYKKYCNNYPKCCSTNDANAN